MKNADLHTHSNYSDGELSPRELIDAAIERKLSAIALTDHDTASGNKEAIEYAKDKDIEFVPGIEITITPPEGCKELHMVGLFINPENEEILDIPKRHKKYREEGMKKILEKLNDLGYEISFEEFLKETKGKHFGRPFLAKIIMRKYPEEFPERQIVFEKLLGQNGKAFVKYQGTDLEDAIKIIHNAGGIAIIAHPWYLGENMKQVIEEFIEAGGDGIERQYKKDEIPEEVGETLDNLIEGHNLIVSGGTDFHKFQEGEEEIGNRGITKEQFETMKEKIK